MRSMLHYLATHSVERPGEAVKEFALATSALGKGADYDPRSDSTVRVVASRLRGKLAEYYTGEGAQDAVIITIPKGAYLISAAYRTVERSPVAAETRVVAPEGSRTRRSWMVGAAAGAAGLAGGYGLSEWLRRPSIPEVVRTFWRGFVVPGAPILVYSNPRFVGSPGSGLKLSAGAAAEAPVNGLYTGAGEVMAVHELSRLLRTFGVDARVKRAQLFTWDDARSNDLIFVGGQEQNLPMSQLPKLEKFNLKPESQEPFLSHGAVKNEKVGVGEEAYYMASDDLENGSEYALIALTRGVTPDKRVLILAGVRTFGTEGAASAVCNPAVLAELLGRLDVPAGGTVPPFEALLELRLRGGAALDPKLRIVHKRSDGPLGR